MVDDTQSTAAQAEQSTPSAQEQGSESQESQVHAQEGESTESNATSENQKKEAEQSSSDGESGDQSGQGTKPTRVERRINQLLTKVKEVGQSQAQDHQQQVRREPIVTDEEREAGQVDPAKLDERIQKTVQATVQRAIQMDRINQQYTSAVKEHQTDLESVKDLDPDLESEAVSEYEALNYQINPLTGQKVFIPAVKFSEVVAKIQSRAEKIANKRATEIAEGNQKYLENVSSNQAVPSSGNVSGSRSIKDDTTDFSEFEKAHTSRKKS